MEIVNVRIDERLVHAQVAAVWASTLNATKIVVVDDGASQDEIQQVALKMACPKTVKLSIISAKRAAEKLLEEPSDSQDRLFIVMKGVKTLKKISDCGYIFPEVNIGNLSAKEDGVSLKRSVTLNQEQMDIILELNKKGTKFTSQLVPTEEKIDLVKLIREKAQ
ncbi:MAG: PTS system mannose/fructose/N-acetylgalactosamine-transporter subunit IIB [Anaerorhabdus sp.]|uniref:PTS system mannose/fructose/N-acetylgalactosamine-transporter subunit IIB n=1 Tax=Anaerorhabdus sp. TaxID=1872524 RepID=UPI003A88650F